MVVLRFGMYFPVKTIFCSHSLTSKELTTKIKQTEDIACFTGRGWGGGTGLGKQQRGGEIFANVEKFDKQTKASVVILAL